MPNSGKPSIGTNHLRVYPATVGAREKRHDIGDVLWKPYPLQRRQLAELADSLLTLAFEQQFRPHRPGRHRVDGDRPPARRSDVTGITERRDVTDR